MTLLAFGWLAVCFGLLTFAVGVHVGMTWQRKISRTWQGNAESWQRAYESATRAAQGFKENADRLECVVRGYEEFLGRRPHVVGAVPLRSTRGES